MNYLRIFAALSLLATSFACDVEGQDKSPDADGTGGEESMGGADGTGGASETGGSAPGGNGGMGGGSLGYFCGGDGDGVPMPLIGPVECPYYTEVLKPVTSEIMADAESVLLWEGPSPNPGGPVSALVFAKSWQDPDDAGGACGILFHCSGEGGPRIGSDGFEFYDVENHLEEEYMAAKCPTTGDRVSVYVHCAPEPDPLLATVNELVLQLMPRQSLRCQSETFFAETASTEYQAKRYESSTLYPGFPECD